MVSELLAPRRVAQMHLDDRGLHLCHGIGNGDVVVAPRRRIDDDRDPPIGGLVEPPDHLRLRVGLAHHHVQPEPVCSVLHMVDEFVMAHQPVDLRLTPAEPAKIGAVEHPDHSAHSCTTSSRRPSPNATYAAM